MTGDLGDVQRLALLAVYEDDQRRAERDKMLQFKVATIAANFDKAAKIIEVFDEMDRDVADGAIVAPKDVVAPTVSDKQFMLDEFRSFGLEG